LSPSSSSVMKQQASLPICRRWYSLGMVCVVFR